MERLKVQSAVRKVTSTNAGCIRRKLFGDPTAPSSEPRTPRTCDDVGCSMRDGLSSRELTYQHIPPMEKLKRKIIFLTTLGWDILVFGRLPSKLKQQFPISNKMRLIPGLAAMSYGALLVAIIWTSMAIYLIDRRFVQATLWAIVACILAGLGLIHQSEADLTFKKLGKVLTCDSMFHHLSKLFFFGGLIVLKVRGQYIVLVQARCNKGTCWSRTREEKDYTCDVDVRRNDK